MTMLTVRRLAADIMKVGQGRVKISPEGLKEAEGALTRSDVKGLIDKGIITKAKIKGRDSTAKRKRRGKGSRKGSAGDQKKRWMEKLRAQRRLLALLVESGALKKKDKRSIYGKVKSGIFRNKKAMMLYLKENSYIAEDYEVPKAEKPVKPAKTPKKEKKGEKK